MSAAQDLLQKRLVGTFFRGYKDTNAPLVCEDGFRISVQASASHRCEPRKDYGPYTEVELGYPSAIDEDIMKYAEDASNPTKTVYSYVPIEVVLKMLEKHGWLGG